MRIAWDNEHAFWDARIVEKGEGYWLTFSEVPMPEGTVITVTPLTGAEGPHLEFEAKVIAQGENYLEEPFSEQRFWSKLEPIDADVDAIDDQTKAA